MKQTKYCLIAIAFFLAACSHKAVPTTQSANVVAAPMSEKTEPKTSVIIGKQLYEANCGKCHELHNTTSFTSNEWRPIMNRMADKAKFNAEQKANVLAYVINNAKNGK
jgi:cytochrome c5